MSRTQRLQSGSNVVQAKIQFPVVSKLQGPPKLITLTSVLATLGVLALAACNDAGKPGPLTTTRPNVTSSTTTSSPALSAPASPSGMATVTCSSARAVPPGEGSSTDLVVGPLLYPGFDHGYNLTMNPPNQDGVRFFKVGTHLVNGSVVTVSVAPEAKAYAGIKTETGSAAGFTTVTYESCPGSQNGSVWWVGGFVLTGRPSGCLPLDIQVKGEATPRRTVIPLGTRDCQ